MLWEGFSGPTWEVVVRQEGRSEAAVAKWVRTAGGKKEGRERWRDGATERQPVSGRLVDLLVDGDVLVVDDRALGDQVG